MPMSPAGMLARGTGAECGYECHSKVASDDYIYTHYPAR